MPKKAAVLGKRAAPSAESTDVPSSLQVPLAPSDWLPAADHGSAECSSVAATSSMSSDQPDVSAAVASVSGDPSVLAASASRAAVVPPESNVELGAFGHCLDMHGHFCHAYLPGERQRGNGPVPGLCCHDLSGETLEVRLQEGVNACCGTSDRLQLVNRLTQRPVGYLDCHHASWLAVLIKRQLIKVSVSRFCVFHPIGGKPPLQFDISAPDMVALIAAKGAPDTGSQVTMLSLVLGRDYTDNLCVEADQALVSRLVDGPFPRPPCKCTSACFIAQYHASFEAASDPYHGLDDF
jgi:hypothetical protein